MRKLNMTVKEEQSGQRVRTLLRQEFAFSEAQLSRLKYADGAVRKNGEPVRLIDPAVSGDLIEVLLAGGSEGEFPLPVLYEDEDILVINKPADMVVHGIEGGAETVESLWRSSRGGVFHGVNRLDRNTSGAMVAAKSSYIHDRLQNLLHTEEFRREYLALVTGCVAQDAGEVDLPLLREDGKTFPSPDGKDARTEYEVLARGDDCTLLKLRLHTGRTHQIRAHSAAMGHPLLGDALYGGGEAKRVMLHSWRIVLRRPLQGDWITVTAPPAEDMRAEAEVREIHIEEFLADMKKENCRDH